MPHAYKRTRKTYDRAYYYRTDVATGRTCTDDYHGDGLETTIVFWEDLE